MPREIRRRYILAKIECEGEFDEAGFSDAVWTNILKLFGEYGASQTELGIIEFDLETKQAILRCSHKALDLVKASLASITKIKNERASVHLQLVSGTLKALRRKAQRAAK